MLMCILCRRCMLMNMYSPVLISDVNLFSCWYLNQKEPSYLYICECVLIMVCECVYVCVAVPLGRLLGELVAPCRTAQNRLGSRCNRRYVGYLVLHCSSAVASCYLLLNLRSPDCQHRACRAKGRKTEIYGYRGREKCLII